MRARGSIFIGLALTSHDTTRTTEAQFSDVVTTGQVSGPWQVANIGGANPNNSPGNLHITVKDTWGGQATIVHPDPDASLTTEWTEWRIPLADFSTLGVDTAAAEGICVGIDNRDRQTQASSGVVYIDDITVLGP